MSKIRFSVIAVVVEEFAEKHFLTVMLGNSS